MVEQSRWLLDGMTCVRFGHVALQSGWRELLSFIVNSHHYKSVETFNEDIGIKVAKGRTVNRAFT